jgi:hypothetical protein
MHKQRILLSVSLLGFLALSLVIALEPGTNAQAAPPKTSSINVTTIVYDLDETGTPLLMRSDDYNGAGQATYITFKGKGANSPFVYSQITTAGEWSLSMNDLSGRTLWITPNQAIDGSQPVAPPAGFYVIQKTYSVCRDQSGNSVPFPNLINGSGNCSLAVNLIYGDILYKLIMRPGALEGTSCPSGGCPPTGLARVTCNAVTSNKCVNWTITPNAAATLAGVANLYSYTGPRGAEWVFVGQYNNTFRIDVSNP